MRGLAKQLKPKLDNPDAVCVYKTSGMRIGHLIPRLKGIYVRTPMQLSSTSVQAILVDQ